jgi:hypothetical protein
MIRDQLLLLLFQKEKSGTKAMYFKKLILQGLRGVKRDGNLRIWSAQIF